jgi:hypothetical protein
MKKRGKVDSNKFNYSDWLIIVILGVLVLSGLLFGLFKLIELEQQALDSQVEAVLENDSEVRGSQVLDLFVSKKSALLLAVDDCKESTGCADYLAAFFVYLVSVEESASPVLVFDIAAARARGDTNLEVALQQLGNSELPALVLVKDGVEIARKEGIANQDDELYDWLVENGIVANEENSRD